MNRCLRLLLACTLSLAWLPVHGADYLPGKSYFGRNDYVEYIAGDLPVILSAPHGGREKPDEMPDREVGTFAFDTNTQELAREVAKEFHDRTGHYPHVVICRLQRKKVDCNREIAEGAAGNVHAEQAWRNYHDYLDEAAKAVVAASGKGFFIDLHGHGHMVQRLELGYLHSLDTLKKPESELNKTAVIDESSLRYIARQTKQPYVELLRGPRSFGAMMEAAGFPSAPSKDFPTPADPYFRGGYNTSRYARSDSPIAGLQIESNFKGVRDSEKSRAAFARALVSTVTTFLHEQMQLDLPAAGKTPDKAGKKP